MSNIAIKLSTLFVRQISKPVANLIKAEAKNHVGFKRFCVKVAQSIHFFENGLNVKLFHGNKKHARPLNEARAIENGANFLSEAFIFGVASGALLFETNRQRLKEKGRREALADDIATLQNEIEQMKQSLKQYKIVIDDYRVPDDYKPHVLKVDKEGKVVSNGHADELDARQAAQEQQFSTRVTKEWLKFEEQMRMAQEAAKQKGRSITDGLRLSGQSSPSLPAEPAVTETSPPTTANSPSATA